MRVLSIYRLSCHNTPPRNLIRSKHDTWFFLHTTQWRCSHVRVSKFVGGRKKAWERMSVVASTPLFMPHTKAWHLQLAISFIISMVLYIISSSCCYLILKVTLCARLKRMISSDKLVLHKGENASFIQILISFYIQSEVVTLYAFFFFTFQ